MKSVVRYAVSLSLLMTSLWAKGEDLGDELDLDYLMNVEVSSVTTSKMTLKDVPAAVTIITAEDIRKAGFQSVPEALRLVPGIQVLQLNSNVWSISSRGFASRYSDKLLVLIDGRSVYSTLFSGVFWEEQDMVLEDIERIEVVRGPGATLWGANAVNGVINIITKNAKETQGTYAKALIGTHLQGLTSIRHGDQINEDLFYRASFKYRNVDSTESVTGASRPDDWDLYQIDLRFDWELSEYTELSLKAGANYSNRIGTEMNLFGGRAGIPVPYAGFAAFANPDVATIADQRVRHQYLNFLWKHESSLSTRMEFSSYVENAERTNPLGIDRRQTLDFDYKYYWQIDARNQLAVGAGLRTVWDSITDTETFDFADPKTTKYTRSAFLEYTHELIPNKLTLVGGSKFEVNDYTGFEVQPNLRLSYKVNEKNVLWTSFSRAVKTPARFEDNLRVNMAREDVALAPGAPPAAVQLRGNSGIKSEVLQAYEMGWRSTVNEKMSTDVALFYNRHQRITTYATDPATLADLTTPIVQNFTNNGSANTFGAELTVNYLATEDWRLGMTYAFIRDDEDHTEDNSSEHSVAQNAVNIHSHYNLHPDFSFHTHAYYKDNLVADGFGQSVRLDAGVIYKINDSVELSLWGQNLLDPSHPETVDGTFGANTSYIVRSFYAELTAKF